MTRAARDAHAKALAMLQAGNPAAAEATLRAGLLRQRDPSLSHLLGLALSQQGKGEQALYFLRSAAEQAPASGLYRAALGNQLAQAGEYGAATEQFRRAMDGDPGHAPAYAGLAFCLMKSGDLSGAEAAAREAVARDAQVPQTRVNLASILTESGRAEEAAGVLERARADFPRAVPVLTALMVTLNYVEGGERRAAEAARALASLLPVGPPPAFPNAPDPDRRLRVACISGDLRQHSVAYFLEPILAERARAGLEVVCYSTGPKSDATTERLRALADGWVDAAGLTGEAFAARLRADRTDIALELSGHTSSSRVLALARRGAPVQASYLGYPASTGVPAIDWRIVDEVTDPAGSEWSGTERLMRLPGCFLTYRPPAEAPEVVARREGVPVTFGSFNSMRKVTGRVLETWAAVVRGVPGSRLVLKNRSLSDAGVRERTLAALERAGVERWRVELLGPAAGVREHLAAYGGIDVALDTFPYNGTTTTCEALWMGVPVVTFAGAAHAGRVGASLLGAAGLRRFVAPDPGAYVAVAAGLAADAAGLAELRGGLRAAVRASALCDASRFAGGFEGVLREMWREWCRSRPGPGPR